MKEIRFRFSDSKRDKLVSTKDPPALKLHCDASIIDIIPYFMSLLPNPVCGSNLIVFLCFFWIFVLEKETTVQSCCVRVVHTHREDDDSTGFLFYR